jgi:tetratricopeptide (TPR) repeat protein
VAYCLRALELDPLSISSYTGLGRVYATLDRLPEAAEAFRKGLEISPDATSIHSLLALVLDAQGRPDEALAEALKEKAAWARRFALGILHHNAGRPEESDRALRSLIEESGHDAAYQVAVVYAVRGEADAEFQWLERAYAQRDSGLAFLTRHGQFRPLHGDPRWKRFVDKMGFPD